MKEYLNCNRHDHYQRSLANQPNHAQFKDFQKHENPGWCGPACIQYVALLEGLHYTQSQLARILQTTHEDGTSHEHMISGAKFIGLKVARIEGQRIEALAEILPQYHIIVNWMDGPNDADDGHYSILKEVKDDMVTLGDRVMKMEEFEKKWYDFEKESRVDRWAMIVRKTTP